MSEPRPNVVASSTSSSRVIKRKRVESDGGISLTDNIMAQSVKPYSSIVTASGVTEKREAAQGRVDRARREAKKRALSLSPCCHWDSHRQAVAALLA
jgi:hypothetical protein